MLLNLRQPYSGTVEPVGFYSLQLSLLCVTINSQAGVCDVFNVTIMVSYAKTSGASPSGKRMLTSNREKLENAALKIM